MDTPRSIVMPQSQENRFTEPCFHLVPLVSSEMYIASSNRSYDLGNSRLQPTARRAVDVSDGFHPPESSVLAFTGAGASQGERRRSRRSILRVTRFAPATISDYVLAFWEGQHQGKERTSCHFGAFDRKNYL